MQRTLYANEIFSIKQKHKNAVEYESLQKDLVNVIVHICKKEKLDKKIDYAKDKKVVYIESYEYNEEAKTIVLVIKSAKYASSRNVIDTEKMIDRGRLKRKEDGDEETTHCILKFDSADKAVCLIEYNRNGIGLKKFLTYLNDFIKEYHKERKEAIFYRLDSVSIVSNDFLRQLEKTRRIKAVTLTVEQEDIKVSDYKRFSGRADLSPEVDIVLKPTGKGKGIFNDTVKYFFKLYEDDDKIVKRITVDADVNMVNDGSLKFDTEQIKDKIILELEESATGEVNSSEIIIELKKYIKNY